MDTVLSTWLARAGAFRREAHAILSTHEAAASSRIVVLDATYRRLQGLNLRQDDLMKQALRCVEHELYRAAHVMAWAALMDFLEEKLASDGLEAVSQVRPKWRYTSMGDMRESETEHQIISVGRDAGLYSKTEMKALYGLLNRRNECAHPSDYYPELNDTLGYISELLKRIQAIQPRTL